MKVTGRSVTPGPNPVASRHAARRTSPRSSDPVAWRAYMTNLPFPFFVQLPNGSRLSCGRHARGRKAVERQTKRLAGEATQFLLTCERPPASSACYAAPYADGDASFHAS